MMLSNLDSGYFKVTLPLKMVTVDTMNKDGKYEENLGFTKMGCNIYKRRNFIN